MGRGSGHHGWPWVQGSEMDRVWDGRGGQLGSSSSWCSSSCPVWTHTLTCDLGDTPEYSPPHTHPSPDLCQPSAPSTSSPHRDPQPPIPLQGFMYPTSGLHVSHFRASWTCLTAAHFQQRPAQNSQVPRMPLHLAWPYTSHGPTPCLVV